MAHRPHHGFTDAARLTAGVLDPVGDGFGRLVAAFARAVGPQLAAVATPVRLRGDTLVVRCSSSSWAQSIGMVEADVVARLLQEAPGCGVRRIQARAGAPVQPSRPPSAAPLAPLPAPRLQQLRELVEMIPDPALRARVLAAAEASERRRRAGVNP